jgi:hypothetical protein
MAEVVDFTGYIKYSCCTFVGNSFILVKDNNG